MTVSPLATWFIELCTAAEFWRRQAPNMAQSIRAYGDGIGDVPLPRMHLKVTSETGAKLIVELAQTGWTWKVFPPDTPEHDYDAPLASGEYKTLGQDLSADTVQQILQCLRGKYCSRCGQKVPE